MTESIQTAAKVFSLSQTFSVYEVFERAAFRGKIPRSSPHVLNAKQFCGTEETFDSIRHRTESAGFIVH